jgi:hypothetical protein
LSDPELVRGLASLVAQNRATTAALLAQRTKSEIEEPLAKRFPGSEALGLVQALPA